MELTKEIFQNALQRVILPSDDVVLIYSGIWSFSHRLGCPSKEAPERIMGWIEEVIGPDRTLIFPTYALSFPTTRRYNPGTTPSEVGLLSQTSVQRHGFKRTLQPMYNYAVKGPASDHIFALPCSTSWGEDGLMGWIRRVNGRICVLGVPWHISCSYIHMGEELSQVPYRYPKTFHGIRAVSETQMTACSETMYVRSAAVTPKFDYGTASQAIRGVASFLPPICPLCR